MATLNIGHDVGLVCYPTPLQCDHTPPWSESLDKLLGSTP